MNTQTESVITEEKTELTSAPKKSKGKRAGRILLKILVSLLVVIVLLSGVTAAANAVLLKINSDKAARFPAAGCAQLKTENYADGCWNLLTDNGLKVLQLTDIHLGGGWMSTKKDLMALNAVAAIISAEKPDFVIVTGDLAYPVPFQAGTFNNRSGAKLFAELMETLGVYWTLAYGNHDTESYSYYNREDMTAFYGSGNYPHCLLQNGSKDADGNGNQVFNIVNSDGVVTRSLIIIDSHSYVDGDIFGIQWKYDNIHENQIAWYEKTVEELNTKNKDTLSSMSLLNKAKYLKLSKTVPTSVFLHIPLTEYKDAWNEYVKNGNKDTANTKYNYGVAGETGPIVYCGIHDDNFFETMLDLGSTDTVFCGHDHLNNFSVNYKGIELTYGMSIDYLAYSGIAKLGSQRGCTVINVDKGGQIDYNAQNYYQDTYPSYYAKETVTMQQY